MTWDARIRKMAQVQEQQFVRRKWVRQLRAIEREMRACQEVSRARAAGCREQWQAARLEYRAAVLSDLVPLLAQVSNGIAELPQSNANR